MIEEGEFRRTLRILVTLLLACTLLASCGRTSSRSLHSRCTDLYRSVDRVLTNLRDLDDSGALTETEIADAEQRLNKLAGYVPELRQDVADGGERHRWKWPRLIVNSAIKDYSSALSGLPFTLADVKSETAASFNDLRWFCNRASSAVIGVPPPDDSVYGRFKAAEQPAYIREILAAVQTEEEGEALFQYMIEAGILR